MATPKRMFASLCSSVFVLALSAQTTFADSPQEVHTGLFGAGGFQSGTYGLAIPIRAGIQHEGLIVRPGEKLRPVLKWDTEGAVGGGYAGNEHPGYTFWMGNLKLKGAMGVALPIAGTHWAPYAEIGARANVSTAGITAPSGTPGTANNTAGLTGLVADTGVRAGIGPIYQNGPHTIVPLVFVQASARAPQGPRSENNYAEVGVGLDYHWRDRLRVTIEAVTGKALPTSDPLLGLIDQASYAEVMAKVTLRYKKFYTFVEGSVSRQSDTVSYSGAGTYQTSGPYNTSIAAGAGGTF